MYITICTTCTNKLNNTLFTKDFYKKTYHLISHSFQSPTDINTLAQEKATTIQLTKKLSTYTFYQCYIP